MPKLYLRAGAGWHPVNDVVDVIATPGKLLLENGEEVNGDLVSIIMDFLQFDPGQVAMRRLAAMEARIVDMRIDDKLEMSVILCGDDVDDTNPKRYAILGRVLGIRKAGDAPELRGAGGGIVGLDEIKR